MDFKKYMTVQRKVAQPSFFSDHLESQQILYFYVKVQEFFLQTNYLFKNEFRNVSEHVITW